MLRGAVLLTVLCTTIAGLLTAMKGGRFGTQLVYSFSIGVCCWFIIDLGRVLVAALIDRRRAARGLAPLPYPGFPGWLWMIAMSVLGVLVGPMVGTALADVIQGSTTPNVLQLDSPSSQVTMLLTVLTSIVSVITLSSMERLASARASAEAAKRAAAEHQLKLLESQLEPHMLFNTLANLRVLIATDPARAQAMLDQLIAFLRATLGASRVAQHPLSAEFARLGDYLALMKVRMDARLATTLDLPDALADHPVPPLLLQPLVENAIKHGLEPTVAGGRVRVSAAREGNELVLRVHDSGGGLVGPTSPATPTTAARAAAGHRDGSSIDGNPAAFGLAQVRERLSAWYGPRASLQLTAAPGGERGTLATVRLPFEA
ncbi:MAG: hypothetical protein AD742_07625 [Methylibium sp. NZG]|nr:MAG: hypothetical protein AD742_07625 [Methylibium sp. NZG]